MRWLLILCVAGLLAYALIPQRPEPAQIADAGIATARTEAAKAADLELRSWGSTLKSLRHREQPAESQPVKQEADYRPGGDAAKKPKPAVGPVGRVGPEADAQIIEAVAEPVAWARVAFAAKAHSEASISSPIIKFYPAGTQLQVVERDGAWIELLDPETHERGWVFDKYLVSIDGPSPAKATPVSTAEAEPADAVTPNVQPVRQTSTPAAASNNTEVSRKARRWAKKQERRERKLRRLFGNARPAAWSLGSAR
jgi:Bacterial SH3 domain